MFRFLFSLILAFGFFCNTDASNTVDCAADYDVVLLDGGGGNIALTSFIAPGTLNKILKVAASNWNMSLGQTHQVYDSGAMLVTVTLKDGKRAYDVDYSGTVICLFDDSL